MAPHSLSSGHCRCGRGFRGFHAPIPQANDLVQTPQDFVIVRHNNGCRSLLDSQLPKKIHDDCAALGIERGRWFVGKDDPRLVSECPCDGYALRLAAGELRRHGVAAMSDLQVLQQF